MATLVSAAAYDRTFLSNSVARSTRTTLRNAACAAPAPSSGPATVVSSRSTADPPVAGSASCPNRVRRNGMSSTKVTASSTEATTVVARLTMKSGVYGRSSCSSRVLRVISARPSRTPRSADPPPAPPRREQGDREDHFFRRHAAVQERPAVARLILAQLRGIDEEPVRRRQQQPHAEPHAREA